MLPSAHQSTQMLVNTSACSCLKLVLHVYVVCVVSDNDDSGNDELRPDQINVDQGTSTKLDLGT